MANISVAWQPLIFNSSVCGSLVTNCVNGGACTSNSQCLSGCCASVYDYWEIIYGGKYNNKCYPSLNPNAPPQKCLRPYKICAPIPNGAWMGEFYNSTLYS